MKKLIFLLIGIILAYNINVYADAIGYGVDLSYQLGVVNKINIGTFETGNFYNIDGARYLSEYSSLWTETLTSMENLNKGIDLIVGSITYAEVTSEAARNGNYGLKLNYSALNDMQGFRFQTRDKLVNMNGSTERDIYAEIWYKADGLPFDGTGVTVAGYDKRKQSPLSLSFNANSPCCTTEEEYCATDENGWKKLALTLPADNLQSTLFAYICSVRNPNVELGNRTYIYLDDFYITKIPRNLGFASNQPQHFYTTETPRLSIFTVNGYDKTGAAESISWNHPRLKWSVESGNAHIENDRIIYDGNIETGGTVTLKAEFITNSATITLNFKNDFTSSDVTMIAGSYYTTVVNSSDANKNAMLLIGLYDNNNRLINLYTQQAMVEANNSAQLTIGEVISEGDMRAYLWDSVTGMRPLVVDQR